MSTLHCSIFNLCRGERLGPPAIRGYYTHICPPLAGSERFKSYTASEEEGVGHHMSNMCLVKSRTNPSTGSACNVQQHGGMSRHVGRCEDARDSLVLE